MKSISPFEFIAQVAWPAVILLVALVYRRLLGDLISGGVTRLRAGPFELAWDQAKSGIERPSRTRKTKAAVSDVPTSPTQGPFSFIGPEVVSLATSKPRDAILCTYEFVRGALSIALSELGVELDFDELDALGLVREAESRGIVPPETTDAVMGLNVLHNLAKHSPVREMSSDKAYEYIAMADGALYSLAHAIRKYHMAHPETQTA